MRSNDGDNNGQGSSSSSHSDVNNGIAKQETDGSNVAAVELLPNEEIKRETVTDDIPFIAFENPDIEEARALYGKVENKHKKCPQTRKKYPQTGYKCSMCKFVAKRKWLLALHRQWHITQKPYKCRFCQTRFSSRSKCKLHLVKHAKSE